MLLAERLECGQQLFDPPFVLADLVLEEFGEQTQ
jgi:hypothetical protein